MGISRTGWLFALVGPVAFALVAVIRPGNTHIAYACTGGTGPLHQTAVESDAIVIARAVSVGGDKNAAPTVTPMPTPQGGYPLSEWDVDLQGIGAELRVIQAVGNIPVQIEVDMQERRRVEEMLRRIEANPHTILPCPPDFGVNRYLEGQTYLLFLKLDEHGEWFTFQQWETDGPDLLTGGSTYEAGRPALVVTKPVLDAYFAGLTATTFHITERDALWVIDQERVPLENALAAVLALRSGAHPTPTPAVVATSPPDTTRITPPDTGDAGLR